jgi:hypothetical protein
MGLNEMNNKRMKHLMEQYWRCETSTEEEQRLQEFFAGNAIPEELTAYTALFAWKEKQKNSRIDRKKLSIPQKSLFADFYPALRIAASVLVIITLGIGFHTHYQQEKVIDKMFSETFTEPEDTIGETGDVIAKVSPLLQLAPEKALFTESHDTLELQKTDYLNDSLE